MVGGDRGARPDHLECGHPDTVTNRNRAGEEPKLRVAPIVIAGADIAPLADADIGADRHLAKIVNPNTFPQPYIVADIEEPRVFDRHSRLADKASAGFGAEQPQHLCFHGRRHQGQQRAVKKQGIGKATR